MLLLVFFLVLKTIFLLLTLFCGFICTVNENYVKFRLMNYAFCVKIVVLWMSTYYRLPRLNIFSRNSCGDFILYLWQLMSPWKVSSCASLKVSVVIFSLLAKKKIPVLAVTPLAQIGFQYLLVKEDQKVIYTSGRYLVKLVEVRSS